VSTVAAHKSRSLYILTNGNDTWWIATLATNRRNCWEQVLKYATKKELQRKGYKCIRVKLEAV
jgi:hypothetical protein